MRNPYDDDDDDEDDSYTLPYLDDYDNDLLSYLEAIDYASSHND